MAYPRLRLACEVHDLCQHFEVLPACKAEQHFFFFFGPPLFKLCYHRALQFHMFLVFPGRCTRRQLKDVCELLGMFV